jgi:hypothetical protein
MARSVNSFLPRKQKKRLNAPPKNQPWCWETLEFLQSGAMRVMSINGRRVLDRIKIEHMNHAGLENGRLKVTWDDFVKFGITRRLIGAAITEVIALGIVAITQPGRRVSGEDHGDPTQYRLTFLPTGTPENHKPATNEWKRFDDSPKMAKEAIQRAEKARQAAIAKARHGLRLVRGD